MAKDILASDAHREVMRNFECNVNTIKQTIMDWICVAIGKTDLNVRVPLDTDTLSLLKRDDYWCTIKDWLEGLGYDVSEGEEGYKTDVMYIDFSNFVSDGNGNYVKVQ